MLNSRKRKASPAEKAAEISKTRKLRVSNKIFRSPTSSKPNSVAKTKLSKLLPDGYECIILTANTKPDANVEGNEALFGCVRLPIISKEDALLWVKKFERKTFTSYVSPRVWKNDSSTGLFKRKFLCKYQTSKGPDVGHSCGACIIFTIKDAKVIQTNPDYYLRDYPSQVIIQFCHNHKIEQDEYLKNLCPTTEMRVVFDSYFGNGHSPFSALVCHKCDLHSSYGADFYNVVSNGAICPSYNWCYGEFEKLFKRKFVDPNEDELILKLSESVDQYNTKCNSECAVLTNKPFTLSICTPLMKSVFRSGFAEDLITVRSFCALKVAAKRQKLILFLCHTPIGSLPFGLVLTYAEDTKTVCQGINSLLKMLSVSSYSPKTIITDENALISKSIKKSFPTAQVLFNEFQMLQSIWRIVRLVCQDKNDEFETLYSLFLVTLNSPSEEDFKMHFGNLMVYAETYPNLTNFLKYFKLRSNCYVLYARPKVEFNTDVLNYTDSGTIILQDVSIKYGDFFNVIQLFDFLSKTYVNHYERKLVKIIEGDLKGFFKTNFFVPPIKLAEFTSEKISDTEFLVKLKDTKFFVNAELDTCTCQVGVHGGSCIHQYIVETNLGLVPECYTPLGEDMMDIFKSILAYKDTKHKELNNALDSVRADLDSLKEDEIEDSDTGNVTDTEQDVDNLGPLDEICLTPSEITDSFTEDVETLLDVDAEYEDPTEDNEQIVNDSTEFKPKSDELEPVQTTYTHGSSSVQASEAPELESGPLEDDFPANLEDNNPTTEMLPEQEDIIKENVIVSCYGDENIKPSDQVQDISVGDDTMALTTDIDEYGITDTDELEPVQTTHTDGPSSVQAGEAPELESGPLEVDFPANLEDNISTTEMLPEQGDIIKGNVIVSDYGDENIKPSDQVQDISVGDDTMALTTDIDEYGITDTDELEPVHTTHTDGSSSVQASEAPELESGPLEDDFPANLEDNISTTEMLPEQEDIIKENVIGSDYGDENIKPSDQVQDISVGDDTMALTTDIDEYGITDTSVVADIDTSEVYTYATENIDQLNIYEEVMTENDKKTAEIAEFLTNLPDTNNLSFNSIHSTDPAVSSTDQYKIQDDSVMEELSEAHDIVEPQEPSDVIKQFQQQITPSQAPVSEGVVVMKNDEFFTQYRVMENGVLSIVTDTDDDYANQINTFQANSTKNFLGDSYDENNFIMMSPNDLFDNNENVESINETIAKPDPKVNVLSSVVIKPPVVTTGNQDMYITKAVRKKVPLNVNTIKHKTLRNVKEDTRNRSIETKITPTENVMFVHNISKAQPQKFILSAIKNPLGFPEILALKPNKKSLNKTDDDGNTAFNIDTQCLAEKSVKDVIQLYCNQSKNKHNQENDNARECEKDEETSSLKVKRLTQEKTLTKKEPLIQKKLLIQHGPLTQQKYFIEEDLLIDEGPFSEEEILTQEQLVTQEEHFIEEDILAEEGRFIEEEVLTQEEPLTEEGPSIDEEVLTQEEPLTEEGPFIEEKVLTQEEPLTEEEFLLQEEHLTEEDCLTQKKPINRKQSHFSKENVMNTIVLAKQHLQTPENNTPEFEETYEIYENIGLTECDPEELAEETVLGADVIEIDSDSLEELASHEYNPVNVGCEKQVSKQTIPFKKLKGSSVKVVPLNQVPSKLVPYMSKPCPLMKTIPLRELFSIQPASVKKTSESAKTTTKTKCKIDTKIPLERKNLVLEGQLTTAFSQLTDLATSNNFKDSVKRFLGKFKELGTGEKLISALESFGSDLPAAKIEAPIQSKEDAAFSKTKRLTPIITPTVKESKNEKDLVKNVKQVKLQTDNKPENTYTKIIKDNYLHSKELQNKISDIEGTNRTSDDDYDSDDFEHYSECRTSCSEIHSELEGIEIKDLSDYELYKLQFSNEESSEEPQCFTKSKSISDSVNSKGKVSSSNKNVILAKGGKNMDVPEIQNKDITSSSKTLSSSKNISKVRTSKEMKRKSFEKRFDDRGDDSDLSDAITTELRMKRPIKKSSQSLKKKVSVEPECTNKVKKSIRRRFRNLSADSELSDQECVKNYETFNEASKSIGKVIAQSKTESIIDISRQTDAKTQTSKDKLKPDSVTLSKKQQSNASSSKDIKNVKLKPSLSVNSSLMDKKADLKDNFTWLNMGSGVSIVSVNIDSKTLNSGTSGEKAELCSISSDILKDIVEIKSSSLPTATVKSAACKNTGSKKDVHVSRKLQPKQLLKNDTGKSPKEDMTKEAKQLENILTHGDDLETNKYEANPHKTHGNVPPIMDNEDLAFLFNNPRFETVVLEPVETKEIPQTVNVPKKTPSILKRSKKVPKSFEEPQTSSELDRGLTVNFPQILNRSKKIPQTIKDAKKIPQTVNVSKKIPLILQRSKRIPQTLKVTEKIPQTDKDVRLSTASELHGKPLINLSDPRFEMIEIGNGSDNSKDMNMRSLIYIAPDDKLPSIHPHSFACLSKTDPPSFTVMSQKPTSEKNPNQPLAVVKHVTTPKSSYRHILPKPSPLENQSSPLNYIFITKDEIKGRSSKPCPKYIERGKGGRFISTTDTVSNETSTVLQHTVDVSFEQNTKDKNTEVRRRRPRPCPKSKRRDKGQLKGHVTQKDTPNQFENNEKISQIPKEKNKVFVGALAREMRDLQKYTEEFLNTKMSRTRSRSIIETKPHEKRSKQYELEMKNKSNSISHRNRRISDGKDAAKIGTIIEQKPSELETKQSKRFVHNLESNAQETPRKRIKRDEGVMKEVLPETYRVDRNNSSHTKETWVQSAKRKHETTAHSDTIIDLCKSLNNEQGNIQETHRKRITKIDKMPQEVESNTSRIKKEELFEKKQTGNTNLHAVKDEHKSKRETLSPVKKKTLSSRTKSLGDISQSQDKLDFETSITASVLERIPGQKKSSLIVSSTPIRYEDAFRRFLETSNGFQGSKLKTKKAFSDCESYKESSNSDSNLGNRKRASSEDRTMSNLASTSLDTSKMKKCVSWAEGLNIIEYDKESDINSDDSEIRMAPRGIVFDDDGKSRPRQSQLKKRNRSYSSSLEDTDDPNQTRSTPVSSKRRKSKITTRHKTPTFELLVLLERNIMIEQMCQSLRMSAPRLSRSSGCPRRGYKELLESAKRIKKL